jgi:multidrug resistance efflux pump
LISAGQEAGTPEGVRVTGTISAVRETLIQVPRIEGQNARMTLTWLIPNSSEVKQGDIVAEFDRTQQLDLARQALAQYEDLQHKLDQKKAENRANQEERAEAVARAEADLAKAGVQLRVSEVRGEIERAIAEVRQEDARARLESLAISHAQHETADEAGLRLLELQMDRQRRAYERAQRNAELLVMRAPLDGMVAHQYVPRSGSLGPPQIGDQMYRGYPLMRLFDPTEMEVLARVGEPDGETLVIGSRAIVLLDAYPDVSFPARLVTASPVASGGLESPIKQFNARFALDARDPRLMPDLTAAIVIMPDQVAEGSSP